MIEIDKDKREVEDTDREEYVKPTTQKHEPQEFVAGDSDVTLYVTYYY